MNAKLFNASLLTAFVVLASASQANASGYTFDLLRLGNGNGSNATAINNSGQVVGYAGTAGGAAIHATIWNGTTSADLGILGRGYYYSFGYGINDSGQVVGLSASDIGPFLGRATIWNGTTLTDLGTLGGSHSWAYSINNSGQVVGYADTSTGDAHATIWNGTTPTDLGTLGGNSSFASGINNSGQVVGWSETSDGAVHATIWNGTTPTDLGTLGGGYSRATGINDSGQVVGDSNTFGDPNNQHATIWNGTTPTDLNDFLSVSRVNEGWILDKATGINDNGWIVGYVYNSGKDPLYTGGYGLGFLLAPVPEPETYAMFMAGLGLVGFIARRRKNSQA
jgi:probable HAF family extracellular repeat protein